MSEERPQLADNPAHNSVNRDGLAAVAIGIVALIFIIIVVVAIT